MDISIDIYDEKYSLQTLNKIDAQVDNICMQLLSMLRKRYIVGLTAQDIETVKRYKSLLAEKKIEKQLLGWYSE